MIKLLPFILVPVLIVAGLGYWRFVAGQNTPVNPKAGSQTENAGPLEVPKTLPESSVEDRLKSLEDTLAKLIPKVNSLKSTKQETTDTSASDSKIKDLETAVTELKVRVSSLEKATPAPAAASKSPLYIPLGAGGGPWTDQDYNTLNEYQASINPDSYSGYTSMQLEANIRLTEQSGTGYVRLYNVTDSSSISSEVSTTSTTFGLQTSGTFKLPAGQKTYTIQVKSSQGKQLFVQSARIKVNF